MSNGFGLGALKALTHGKLEPLCGIFLAASELVMIAWPLNIGCIYYVFL